MKEMTEKELAISGYKKQYAYTQYSHDNHVNIMPENDFRQLTMDTFETLANNLRQTYGPYGNSIQISTDGATTITKDGHNVFQAIGFSHRYKDLVRNTIYKICDRVNRSVGDGTTSCILLAEKMFKEMRKYVDTPDHKRTILPLLEEIEKHLLDRKGLESFRKTGYILPLTEASLESIIKIAGNYDHELTELLTEAFDAACDEDGNVTKINNVTIKHTSQDFDMLEADKYTLDFLPGQYRTKVYIDDNPELPTILFGQGRKIKVLCYNYSFNIPAWELLWKNYDKETQEEILVISPGINKDFLETAYLKYLNMLNLMAQRNGTEPCVKISFIPMSGLFMQSRMEDLAALLKTPLRTINSGAITTEEFAELPMHQVQLYKDSLCFFDIKELPEAHIESLKRENQDERTSASRITLNKERIRALQLDTNDSIITVTTSSSLEAKILGDKITDCVSIVNSAFHTGIVPNLFKFGFQYIKTFFASDRMTDHVYTDQITGCVLNSITGLFDDIWVSKYGKENDSELEHRRNMMYHVYNPINSYDIISDNFVDMETLSTSTQYDLEVIAAAISIVKYMLDSRAFVFDARLIGSHGDVGDYVRD